MDYKELIELLNEWHEHCISELCGKDVLNCDDLCINRGEECIVHQAISAIETLLLERDAAVEDMKGICSFCVHKKTCQFGNHLRDICVNGSNWQWRGPQKGGG